MLELTLQLVLNVISWICAILSGLIIITAFIGVVFYMLWNIKFGDDDGIQSRKNRK